MLAVSFLFLACLHSLSPQLVKRNDFKLGSGIFFFKSLHFLLPIFKAYLFLMLKGGGAIDFSETLIRASSQNNSTNHLFTADTQLLEGHSLRSSMEPPICPLPSHAKDVKLHPAPNVPVTYSTKICIKWELGPFILLDFFFFITHPIQASDKFQGRAARRRTWWDSGFWAFLILK